MADCDRSISLFLTTGSNDTDRRILFAAADRFFNGLPSVPNDGARLAVLAGSINVNLASGVFRTETARAFTLFNSSGSDVDLGNVDADGFRMSC